MEAPELPVSLNDATMRGLGAVSLSVASGVRAMVGEIVGEE